MGCIDDSEPLGKRAEVLLGDLKKLSEESSHTDITFGDLGEPMAQPQSSQEDREMVGPKGIIKKQEFIKIITRELYYLGYGQTGALLEEESQIHLHSSAASLFIQQVRDGNWDESLVSLHKIGLTDETTVKSASFLILEQKFLDLLKEEKVETALVTLRDEIVPLSINMERVHELAARLISSSQCIGLGLSSQDNVVASSRLRFFDKLEKVLPAVMIPEKRLENLVEQALDVQRDACVFHNTLNDELSLYSDHQCGRKQIPSRTLQVLETHNDEVWFLQFSHSGKFLASSSKDQSAVIWEVKDNGEVLLKHTLNGHQKPVCMISWSPNDSHLLSCGQEEVIRLWDVISGECLYVYEKAGVGLISCGWFPDGKRVVSGLTDKSICLWDLDGKELECWKGQRILHISDMAITDDGKMIISIYRENAILLFDWEAKFERLIEEEKVITSFSLSEDNKFLLVNLVNQEIHLWSIEGDVKIISRYKGLKRARFIIRSCFGGFEQAFIASGSEDSQVYIWHRGTGELLLVLPGHSGAVNCVSWSPKNPRMLASCSDDRTIRIWGIDDLKCEGTPSDGSSSNEST